LERLTGEYNITVFYYNPNIYPAEEYLRRAFWQRKLIDAMYPQGEVGFVLGEYEPERFKEVAAGLDGEPEGGRRCLRCFKLRLAETAARAARDGFDIFSTTLTVSPHKESAAINAIGEAAAAETAVARHSGGVAATAYLRGDFKKQGGYQRSVELSKRYGIYRQRYCGCEYSIRRP
jgi:predicted adenine nucleotide alpha hydrolase (AANH) superfamily ATPase